METNKPAPRISKKWKIILIVLAVLLGVRIAIPYVILHYVNKRLAAIEGYYGHVDDVDLWLYRGAYVIKDIYIDKSDSAGRSDFFKCPRVDLSVEWKAIFEKKFVGEVEFEQPIIQYIMGRNIGQGIQKRDTVDFVKLVKDFMPLRINRFEVNDGEIHYVDYSRSPKVDLPMTHVHIVGTGLTNEPDTALLPASIKMNADLYNGKFTVNTRLDPLKDIPTFDLNATLTDTDLKAFNDFFRAYANCDVESGNLKMYVEVAAKDGEFAGYTKPLVTDLRVFSWKNDNEDPPQLVWEGLVGGVSEVVTNQPRDQIGTKIPMSGKFVNPDIGVMEAIFTLLQNAFIKALEPVLENSITINSVRKLQEQKGVIDRIFKRRKEE